MVISRTPLRISFFGGGTDYPAWFLEHGGKVLSTTINKYQYITCRFLPPFFGFKHRIVWSQIESVSHTDEIVHPSVREVIKFLGIENGIGVHYDGDVPARSGLGSSSAFTVGLLHALHALCGESPTKQQLASEAIHVEQERIRERVGSQDQTAAAFGGFNTIEFGGGNHLRVTPAGVDQKILEALNNHLMLFFTGMARTASDIAASQIRHMPKKTAELRQMMEMTETALVTLRQGRLEDFGRLLHEAWQVKRTLAPGITTPFIDRVYEDVRGAGAIGGKLLGAGGGGFLLVFAGPESHAKIKERMKGFLLVPFRFEDLGSQIIYHMPSAEGGGSQEVLKNEKRSDTTVA